MMHIVFPPGTPAAESEQSDKLSLSVRELRGQLFQRGIERVGARAGDLGARIGAPRLRGMEFAGAMAIIAIIVAAFAARLHGLLASTIIWDEGVYLVMAQQWLHGHLPYVAVWDQHPPGLPALLTAVQAFISDPVLGARLAATAAVIITALVLHRFCVRNGRGQGVGLVAALLYIICISRFSGLAANTEVFNNAAVACAAYLLFEAARGPGVGLTKALLAATLLGLGLQIKYVVLSEAVFLCLGYLALSRARGRTLGALALDAGLLIIAGLLPTGLAIAYFAFNGLLEPFLAANIGANISYLGIASALPEVIKAFASGLLPIGGAISLTAWAVARAPRGPAALPAISSIEGWVFLWMAAAAVNVCLPLKFFSHYFFALYAPACLAGALALRSIARQRREVFVSGVILLFVTAVPVWTWGVARSDSITAVDASRAIARSLLSAGARDMDAFVYDYEPVIYAFAGLRPPTPYVIRVELTEFSKSAGVNGIAEVDRVMDRRPRFIVALADGHPPDALDREMARRLQVYHAVEEFKDETGRPIRVYER